MDARKRLNQVIVTIGMLGLIVFVILASVLVVALRPSFYQARFHSLHLASEVGVSEQELDDSIVVLLDYLQGKRSDIVLMIENGQTKEPMFNTRETLHMQDVRTLFEHAEVVMWGSFVLALVGFALAAQAQDKGRTLKNGLEQAFVFAGILLIGMVIYALLDFDAFWTSFHLLVFDNDLWLLDPLTDRMIRMLPLALFNGLVLRIFVVLAGCLGTIYGCVYTWQKRRK